MEIAGAKGEANISSRSGKSVLVVDDDPHFRRLLKILLEKEELTVLMARNAEEGRVFLKRDPDLLIVDHRMPNEDGFSWIREVRESGNEIPIVFCSGSGCDQKYIEQLRTILKVNLIMQKPIDPHAFSRQIRRLLEFEQCDQSISSIPVQSNSSNRGNRHHNSLKPRKEKGSRSGMTSLPANEGGEESPNSISADLLLPASPVGDRNVTLEQSSALTQREDILPDNLLDEQVEFIAKLPEFLNEIKLSILLGSMDRDDITISRALALTEDLSRQSSSLELPSLNEALRTVDDSLRRGVLIGRKDAEMFQDALLSLERAESFSQELCKQLISKRSNQLPTDLLLSNRVIDGESSLAECLLEQRSDHDCRGVAVKRLDCLPVSPTEVCSEPSLAVLNSYTSQRNVVLVSDDVSILSSCRLCLEAENTAVFTANNRDLALVEITRRQPEVILVDENIALAGAADFCSFIRQCFGERSLLLVLIREPNRRHFAIAQQADDYISIPISEYELERRMSGAVRPQG